MPTPLAYFITFTTYGTWLHGRDPGSVDTDHNEPHTPFLPGDPKTEQDMRDQMTQPEYRLEGDRRAVVLQTVLEVARHRGWQVWAIHVRSNHVHMIITAPTTPEKVMSDVKAWTSRRLREAFGESADRRRWTEHGSTRYVWTESVLADKIAYVVEGQGIPMAVYDSRVVDDEDEIPTDFGF
jgi:REP element-mobilizing transposase RayT